MGKLIQFEPKRATRKRHRHQWRVVGIRTNGAEVTGICYRCQDCARVRFTKNSGREERRA